MKQVRVANVADCPDGQRSNPFELKRFDDHDIDWFIKELNDEMINIEDVFCFLIDTETEKDLTP